MKFIENNKFIATGAKCDDIDLSKPIRVKEHNVEISIITAGWDVIGCVKAKSFGVNQINISSLCKLVSNEKSISDRVIVYLHWGYELETLPSPADRLLAKQLIDVGADLIVGCHAHCFLGYEKYNGKSIFYGLGNFIFSDSYFMKGRISFPSISSVGLTLNYNAKNNDIKKCFIDSATGRQIEDENECNERLIELSKPFKLTDIDYVTYFKRNRRKKILLPIFLNHQDSFSNMMRKKFLKVREVIIIILFNVGIKGGPK